MDLPIAQNQRCVANVGKSVDDARTSFRQTSLGRDTISAWAREADEQSSSWLNVFAYRGNMTLYVLRGYWLNIHKALSVVFLKNITTQSRISRHQVPVFHLPNYVNLRPGHPPVR